MRREILFVAVVVCVGCQAAPRGEVEGTVRRDGKALANVLVTFISDQGTKGLRAAGVTDDQGRYRLQGDDGKPGAVAGGYRATVEDMAIYDAPRDREGTVLKLPPTRFPPTFGDPLRTSLRQNVTPGRQTIDLDLVGNP